MNTISLIIFLNTYLCTKQSTLNPFEYQKMSHHSILIVST